MYMYMYIYIYMHVYIYIYIYANMYMKVYRSLRCRHRNSSVVGFQEGWQIESNLQRV